MSVAVLCAVGLGAMLMCSSTALASRGHLFSKTFSGPCAAEPCAGLLKEPSGVAVSEATGDLYVVDKGANRVARFDAAGAYLGELNGSGTLPGEEHAAGSLKRAGEIETGRFEAPEGIAVDNSCELRGLSEAECKEKDPSSGDVYVVDAGSNHRVIDKYSATGEYLAQMSEAGGEKFQSEPLDGVTVDLEGKAWVYREEPVLDGFTEETPNVFIEAIHLHSGFGLPGVAVDSEGDFYVRRLASGLPRIAKDDHAGNVLIAEVDSEPSSAVAVDQSSDDSFIDNLQSVRVSNAEGKELERLGEEKGEKHLTQGAGLAVNVSAGSLYVADAASDQIVLFGPTEPEPPRIESESIANVTSESAELGAEINPRSEPDEEATEYHFQYGACASPSSCSGSGYEASVPAPDGLIPADFEVHPVSAHVQGLKANTTYHFRAIAKNSLGEGEPGEERVFTTQGPGGELILADERAWELVSPPDKQGAAIEPISETGVVQAAAAGGGITYLANAPTEPQPQGYTNLVQVLSSRGRAAWSSRDIAISHPGATGFAIGPGPEYKFFDRELSDSAVQPFGEFNPALSEEGSESTAYLHDLSSTCASSCFHPLVTGKPGFANVAEGTRFGEEERCEPSASSKSIITCGPQFLGASDDLSHVVLRAGAELQPGAGENQLYEWSGGALRRVSVLPGGEAAAENTAQLGLKDVAARRAISSDGTRIVWDTTAPALYLRETARGETVQLDEGEGCAGCTSGGGAFQIASAEGTRVFFTDTHKLSEDSGAEPTAGKKKADLYECKVAVEAGKLHCALSDLTPKRGEEGADVQGGVLGASEDGSYLYFVANGVLSEAQNARGEKAIAGRANLYLRHGATTSFIATLAGGDRHDWEETPSRQPTRVSANGRFLELMSEARLSGYDNRALASGQPAAEVFIYDASSKGLSCASCDPSGARPVGVEYLKLEPGSGGLVGGPRDIWPREAAVAANVPGWTAIGSGGGQKERYQPRYLTDSGRLFFDSVNALVSQDSNGTQDVYEYEPAGVGSCASSSESFSESSGGCVSLISSGGSAQESAFMDASESGDDVFFLSAAKLSALDNDAALDIYDAHVCTGASPCIEPSRVEIPPCSTEASCKASPTPQPSIFGAPASATFSGPGNPPPAPPAPPKIETRHEKLLKALKACHAKKNKHKRKSCEKSARKKYGAKPKRRGVK